MLGLKVGARDRPRLRWRPGRAKGASVAAMGPSVSPAPGVPPDSGRPADAGLAAVWDAVEKLTAVVEKDHAARLERIERDLKWVMRLVTAVLAALLGASASNFLAG